MGENLHECLVTCTLLFLFFIVFSAGCASFDAQCPNGARGNVAMDLSGEHEDGGGDVDTVSLEKLQMEAKEV